MENIENVDKLTIETIYEMVLEMKSKLDSLESETHAPQSDKAGLYTESTEPRLNNIETDIADMKADIKSIELRLNNVDSEIINIKADIKGIELRLSNVESEIVNIKADIKSIELRLNNVEVDMAAMKTDILNIKADIVEMKRDIATIARDQSKLRDDIYKWGVGLAIGIFVSVCSILSVAVLLVN